MRDVFGVPGQGSHSLRVGRSIVDGGFAAVDLLGTVAVSLVIGRVASGKNLAPGAFILASLIALVVLLAAAVAAHELFDVNTRLNALIFRRPWPSPAQPPKKD